MAGAAAQGGRRRGWAAAQAELGDGDDTAVLRAPGLHGSTCGEAAERNRGSGWPELRRRLAIATAGELT